MRSVTVNLGANAVGVAGRASCKAVLIKRNALVPSSSSMFGLGKKRDRVASSKSKRHVRVQAEENNPMEAAQNFLGGLFKEKADPCPVGSTPKASFTLPSTSGDMVTVPAKDAKCSVVFFFQKSDTPGCKAEGDTFNSLASEFSAKGCQLIGISMEDVESLKNSNAGRDIQLLSDADGAISAAFDAELNLVVAKFSARKTFLLSPSGEIKAKWSEGKDMGGIKDGSHAREVLAAVSGFP